MADILTRIDHAAAGLCPCGAQPRQGSAYCSPDCEPTHLGPDTDAYGSGPRTAARWRPDLVTAFDETGLELHWEQEYANGLASRTYQHADGRLFARLDDGNRWVGMWLSDDDTSTLERADAMWARLERELGDRRRLDPEPDTEVLSSAQPIVLSDEQRARLAELDRATEAVAARRALLLRMGEVLDRAVLGNAEGWVPTLAELRRLGGLIGEGDRAGVSRDPAVPTLAERAAAYADLAAAGTVFWLPDPPADPGAPTPAELAGGVELGRGARPTATWVDESHRVDWSALRRVMEPADQLRRGDRIQVHWSAAGSDRSEVTELEVAEVRPDGAAVTEPVDRSGMAERFRRLGEQVSDPHGYGLAGAGGFQRLVATAAQAESDRVALRTVCTDEAMYERALAAARERDWSPARMFAAVAEGRYTEHGWAGSMRTGEVGNLAGIPIVQSPHVPPGQMYLVGDSASPTGSAVLLHSSTPPAPRWWRRWLWVVERVRGWWARRIQR